MRTQLVIKKEDVVKALMTEPLKSTAFIHSDKYTSNDKCQVCAVGAVLRQKVGGDRLNYMDESGIIHNGICGDMYAATQPDKLKEVIARLLKEKRYLSALSVFFETQQKHKEFTSATDVLQLVKFVKKNFPTKFIVKFNEENEDDN